MVRDRIPGVAAVSALRRRPILIVIPAKAGIQNR
jgi:hypothetical protein